MKVFLRKLKPSESSSFSFPGITASLTDEVIADHGMRPALKRLARSLAEQMNKKMGKEVIGVELQGVTFNMVFVEKRQEPCGDPRRSRSRKDAVAGHCGACEAFRKKR